MTKIDCFFNDTDKHSIKIEIVDQDNYSNWLLNQPDWYKNQLHHFCGKMGNYQILYNQKGLISLVVLIDKESNMWSLAAIATSLPKGYYYVSSENTLIYIGYALAHYAYVKYKKNNHVNQAKLLLPKSINEEVLAHCESAYLVRDLINTPAADLGPEELCCVLKQLAQQYAADFSETVDKDLLSDFPGIYHVGKGSSRLPRLGCLTWGDPSHKKITLIGKGVVFDTGGLDLKPSQAMLRMHKDMGGAAHVIGLAKLIMSRRLPVHLTVYIPTVENAIGPDAFRPSDVISMANGKTVEVGNTDAEGRIILADILYKSSMNKPDLLIDFATLTGAARVAVGTEIAAVFSPNQILSFSLMPFSEDAQDPVWPLPMHQNYMRYIKSDFADISNSGSIPYAGATTAALFLQNFVVKDTQWIHFDIMAWNIDSQPGKPKGGEAMGIRTVYNYLSFLSLNAQ